MRRSGDRRVDHFHSPIRCALLATRSQTAADSVSGRNWLQQVTLLASTKLTCLRALYLVS